MVWGTGGAQGGKEKGSGEVVECGGASMVGAQMGERRAEWWTKVAQGIVRAGV